MNKPIRISESLLRDSSVDIEKLFKRGLLFRLAKGNKPSVPDPDDDESVDGQDIE